MFNKSSSILNNLVFTIRLLTSTDCSIVLVKNDSKITFQHYDNNNQKDFLEQRLKLIEWANIKEYASLISNQELGCITNYFKNDLVFLKLINNSILIVTVRNENISSPDVAEKLEKVSIELKTYCHEIL